MKYTKDRLLDEFLNQSREMVKYVEKIDGTLREMNDQNKLHTTALLKNTEAVQIMVAGNDRFIKTFSIIMMVLVLALVTLAGAEKIIPELANILPFL